METVTDFICLDSKITVDSDSSHEIKRCFLLGRKVMTNLDSILKSRGITLPTKVRLIKAMVFPVVMYGCESWTIRKTEHWRIDAFQLWCWRRPWEFLGQQGDQTSQSWRKSTLNIQWKNWCWSWSSRYFGSQPIGKDPDAGKVWGQEEKGTTENEMVGWHHWLNEHGFG